MSSRIKQLAKRALRSLGLKVQRIHVSNSFDLQRHKLLEHHAIDLVVDGGANEGQYAVELREWGYRNQIISFEPSSVAFERLCLATNTDSKWQAYQVALGDRAEKREFNIAGNSVSSSLLLPVDLKFNRTSNALPVAKEMISVVRLDDFIYKNYNTHRNIFVKLDVQGYEEVAISGAAGILEKARLIELELGLVPLYQDVGDWVGAIHKMRSLGYEMVAVETNTVDERGITMEINAIFMQQTPRTHLEAHF